MIETSLQRGKTSQSLEEIIELFVKYPVVFTATFSSTSYKQLKLILESCATFPNKLHHLKLKSKVKLCIGVEFWKIKKLKGLITLL